MSRPEFSSYAMKTLAETVYSNARLFAGEAGNDNGIEVSISKHLYNYIIAQSKAVVPDVEMEFRSGDTILGYKYHITDNICSRMRCA